MTIHCLGSINIDRIYRVGRLPALGETLEAEEYETGLGGKGTNQALAAAAAGTGVCLTGAVGADAVWAIGTLNERNVDTANVHHVDVATGHAVVFIEPDGENRIVSFGGANRAITSTMLEAAFAPARKGDWWLVQNETSMVAESLAMAKAKGLRTVYSAAPFSAAATQGILSNIDILAVNEGEALALARHLGCGVEELPVPNLLVTLGARGARWFAPGKLDYTLPAFPVSAIDTTGAGDIFLGYCLAGLDLGMDIPASMLLGSAAAAISVTRTGASSSIPTRSTVDSFISART